MKKLIPTLPPSIVFLVIIMFCNCSHSGHRRFVDGDSIHNNNNSLNNNHGSNNNENDVVNSDVGSIFNENSVPDQEDNYLCVSLSQYVKEYSRLRDSHSAIPTDMETMYGMSWISGYVIDSAKKDIILVGQQKKERPVYQAEDIFTNYQNVFDSTRSPYCSLDPNPQNIKKLNHYLAQKTDDYEALTKNGREILGGQKVVVGGVPSNSRSAKIMIYADYEMKKISQGLSQAKGIKSTIDLSVADSANFSVGASMSRFWFHVKQNEGNKVYPNYYENDGIVFINDCPVTVLTEKQRSDSNGNFTDDVFENDPIALSFAAEMSDNYATLASENVLMAELENMYRLQACLRAIKFKDGIQVARADISKISDFLVGKGNDLPPSLPGLINYKKLVNKYQVGNRVDTETKFFTVAGGVDQAMSVDAPGSFQHAPNNLLIQVHQMIINKAPGHNPIYWHIVVPKKPRTSLNLRGIERKHLYNQLLSFVKGILKSNRRIA